MEFKIFTFSFYLSIFFFIVLALFFIDELRPGELRTEKVISKDFDLDQNANGNVYFFNLTTSGSKKIQLNKTEYSIIQINDSVNLFVTPWFNEVKGYQLMARNQLILSSNYGVNKMRVQIIMASIAGMLLSIISFKSKKFELRVSLSFIVFIITAVRWWLLGK